ncbi:MAG TPA: hypothetical protein VFJ74_10575 [Gemmatimonadaceae bacterium]|nr:hypothetical protein [Gemmatimonadaceae bacterium]
MGCLRRIGCILLVLVALAAAAWFTRDRWLHRGPTLGPRNPNAVGVEWEPLTPEGAERARTAVASLGQRSGPVYANTRAGDLAAYLFTGLQRQLPPSAQDIRAAVIGDRLYVKALVNLTDFGGAKVLGPLAGFLSERDTVTFGGNFELLRQGLAQFHVREIKLRQLSLPEKAIPRLLAQIRRGARPEGVADDALPLVVPSYIGDVRVGQGRVTLYKNVK